MAYLLALIVGAGSFSLYMAAFLFPEVHRKHDLAWSGVGLFYALVLWFCAGQMQGALLLGQTASVVLLCWLGWQMLVLRRLKTPVNQQTLPNASAAELTQRAVDTMKSAADNFSLSETATAVVGVASSAVDAVTSGTSASSTEPASEPVPQPSTSSKPAPPSDASSDAEPSESKAPESKLSESKASESRLSEKSDDKSPQTVKSKNAIATQPEAAESEAATPPDPATVSPEVQPVADEADVEADVDAG